MIERILVGMLASGLPNTTASEGNTSIINYLGLTSQPQDIERNIFLIPFFEGPAKLHTAFLSISLIVGLGYGGFVTYTCWIQGSKFLSYVRNLVIALVCRSFFSLLFEAVVILGNYSNFRSGNALQSFECLSANLVFAFWLLMTVYFHARMQRNFNNEPSIITMYQFGIPGVAVFFSLVWIFAMEGESSLWPWWSISFFSSINQWITCSLRLLYLLIQLALVVDIGKSVMIKSSLDNDSLSLLRKVTLLMGVLVFLFWLQFGLSVGRPPKTDIQPYLYFYYFIDGTQCSIICPIFFFLNKWVEVLINDESNILTKTGEIDRRATKTECVVDGNRTHSIVTIDSLFATEAHKRKNSYLEESKDVVYSSIVQPDQLKKTLELYKRVNHTSEEEGEEAKKELPHFQFELGMKREANTIKKQSEFNQVNKNAFYSSKYLIVDEKKKENYKKTDQHLSVSPLDDDSSIFEYQSRSSGFVKKWLNDQSRISNQENIAKMSKTKSKKEDDNHSQTEQRSRNSSFSSNRCLPGKKLQIIENDFSSNESFSSDSQFDVEKQKKMSLSSREDFSLDNYYAHMKNIRTKFTQEKNK